MLSEKEICANLDFMSESLDKQDFDIVRNVLNQLIQDQKDKGNWQIYEDDYNRHLDGVVEP